MKNTLRLLLTVSVYIVCYGIEIQTVTLSDNTPHKNITLKCPWNQTISVKEITNGNATCKTDENNNRCLQSIVDRLKTECIKRNNCTLSSDILSTNNCHRTARHITTEYRCKLWPFKQRVTATTCATTLSKINCMAYSFLSFYYKIDIKTVILDIPQSSINCNDDAAKLALEKLCNNKVTCLNPSANDSPCLFHPREAKILYYCEDTNALFSSSTYPVTKTDSNATTLYKTDISFSMFTSISSSLTTVASPDTYTERITLDQEGRVLFTNILDNITLLVCGEGWDDRNAYVVCKYQNYSRIGKAKTIAGVQGYETIPLVIQCHGNETSPFDCNKIFLERACSTSMVAAVTCCEVGLLGIQPHKSTKTFSQRGEEHNWYPLEYEQSVTKRLNFGEDFLKSCPTTNVEKMTSGKPPNGIAIGVSVGLGVTILVALSLVFIRRRFNICKKANNSPSIINSSEDYAGNQGIALPNLSKNTNSKNFTQRESENCTKGVFKNDEHKPKPTSTYAPINGVTSPKFCPNLPGTGNIKTALENDGYEYSKSISDENNSASIDTYACSEDGVYDKANKTRHVPNDSNVYSHSIDTVYDTSDGSCNEELSSVTYDHFIGLKSNDNYDVAVRK